MFTLRKTLGVAGVLALTTPAALAIEPNLDFGIADEPSYQAFRGAVSAAEYVRYDYVNERKPRVVGASTALVAYATRNPLADASQLAAFVAAYDQVLAGSFAGDADLRRPAHFLPAVRFPTPIADPALVGTDTNVGDDVLELLGLDIPGPDNFESMRRRMVLFDRALASSLANSSEWASVLVVGFSGRDLAGNANEHLAGALRAYLEAEGYEPVPDGVDDARFAPVAGALASALPADYAGYTAALAQPIETSDAWVAVSGAFLDVTAATDQRLDDIRDSLLDEPSLVEGVANAGNPAVLAQILADYRSQIDEVADERAIISAATMLLFQSAQVGADDLAGEARTFGAIQLDTNDSMAGVNAGIKYAAGALTFIGGTAAGNPTTAISGLANFIMGNIELVDALGDSESPPDPQQLMFDEIADMRNQIEDMRLEMHERFDRVEAQLNIIQLTLRDGFNALGNDIADLTADVEAIARDVFEARASLSRIEDALWGVAQDVLLFELTVLSNDLLDYRDDAGVDLPYGSSDPNFVSGASDFFSWATTIAKNETFAGDPVSSLTVANAADRLGAGSIGRQINDLRVFPASQLGLPALGSTRVVAPAPWAQSASAYAQLAHESPWYFAYMYRLQSVGGGSGADLDLIIAEGEALANIGAAARDQGLFDALFDGYDAGLVTMLGAFDGAVASMTGAEMVSGVDPWGGLRQDVDGLAVSFTQVRGQAGLQTLPLPSPAVANPWSIYGGTDVPELTSILVRGRSPQLGGQSVDENHDLFVTSNGFFVENDMEIIFRYAIDGDHPDLVRRHTRRVVLKVTNTFGDQIRMNTDSDAQEYFEEDNFLWLQVAAGLMGEESRVGETFTAFAQTFGETFEFEVVSDDNYETANPATPFVLDRLAELQDLGWAAVANDPAVQDADNTLRGHVALIDSYVTLGLPELMEGSAVIRAALRANPLTGELSLLFPLDIFALSQVGSDEDAPFADTVADLQVRSAIARSEVGAGLALPAAGHTYVDWMLAELRDLRDRASALAVDDTYAGNAGATLVVPAASGLLANDIDQPFRTIEVDIAFTGAMPLTLDHGVLDLAPDGSFTYTLDPGFSGVETFTYRSFTAVSAGAPSVFSDPATVVILIGASDACNPADLDANGVLNFDDIDAFITGFLGGDLVADLDGNGTLNFDDIDAFVNAFLAGCSG